MEVGPLPFQGELLDRDRLCTRLIEVTESGERVCGKFPTVHIAWRDLGVAVDCANVCEEHREEAFALPHFQWHPTGACCGMPNAKWNVDKNVCYYPGDELQAEEPQRNCHAIAKLEGTDG